MKISRQSILKFLKSDAGLFTVLLLFFALTRFVDLGVKPMHNDEGVNGMFMEKVVRKHYYKYDPSNFHGPSLYFMTAPVAAVSAVLQNGFGNFKESLLDGINEITLRSVVALGGLLVLAGCWVMRRRIGFLGALTALLLLGFSSNMMYFSRYFIHEIFVVLFTFTIYLSLVLYRDTKKARWLYAFAASVSLLFTTKETSAVHFFVLAFSLPCVELVHGLVSGASFRKTMKEFGTLLKKTLLAQPKHLLGAAVLALAIWVLFFSSFFTNAEGLIDSFRAYTFWGKEGVESGHAKPFLYFFDKILFPYEIAPVILSLAGLVIAFGRNDKTGLYLSFWTLGMTGAYSVIPYKTPWCVINIVFPMALLGGYAVQCGWDALKKEEKRLANPKAMKGALAGGLLFLMLFQLPRAINASFVDYDDVKHVMVYQHTDRDIYALLRLVDKAAEKTGDGKKMRINVVSKEHWPLPYYLRHYTKDSYWGGLKREESVDAPVIIAHSNQKNKVIQTASDRYSISEFTFRKGVRMLVMVENSLMDKIENKQRIIPGYFPPIDKPANLLPGPLKLVYPSLRFGGEPSKKLPGITGMNFNWGDPKEKAYEAPFSLRWVGYLKVTKEGPTEFTLNSDDGSWLYIDDVVVIDNGGTHRPETKKRSVNLGFGYHKFELRYFDWLGEAVLDVKWRPPGELEVELPKAALFHTEELVEEF